MIKLILLDCDGCLTDGGYFTSNTNLNCVGEQSFVFKKFNTKDWHRINQILARNPGSIKIITATMNTCIDEQVKRMPNKCDIIRSWNKADYVELNFVATGLYKWEEICYIGDDDLDIPLLAKCGVSACPSDAADEVIEFLKTKEDGIILTRKGGEACVREFLDIIDRMNNYKGDYKNEQPQTIVP